MSMKKANGGFTLIELMIVVAIIGILAAIAVPRFGDILDRAREANLRGELSTVRSATTLYYGRHYFFPASIQGIIGAEFLDDEYAFSIRVRDGVVTDADLVFDTDRGRVSIGGAAGDYIDTEDNALCTW